MIYSIIVDGCWKRPKFQPSAFQGLVFIIFDQCSPMNHRSEGSNPSSSEATLDIYQNGEYFQYDKNGLISVPTIVLPEIEIKVPKN
jgi:hypothetical protein